MFFPKNIPVCFIFNLGPELRRPTMFYFVFLEQLIERRRWTPKIV
jgi:hypothetical protein